MGPVEEITRDITVAIIEHGPTLQSTIPSHREEYKAWILSIFSEVYDTVSEKILPSQ